MKGRPRETRRDWQRQSDANPGRETVSAMFGDRDIQERQRGGAEKPTHRQRKGTGHCL